MKIALRAATLATAALALAGGLSNPAQAASRHTTHPAPTVAGATGTVHRPAVLPHGRGLRAHVAGRATTNSTSSNWSGYAAYGTSFNNVYAKWQVPAVNCSGFATGATSTWVGLDGYGNGTVEQLGTAEQCFWGGSSYHAWYELYPAGEIALPSSYGVYPYDTMEARTMYLAGSRSYYFYMRDISRGWSWSLFVAAPNNPTPTNTTAEWVAEQPSCFYTCSWLANFGTTYFWDAQASRAGYGAQPITAFAHDAITMVNGSTVKAIPSTLYPTTYGSGFNVRWYHS